MCVSLLDNMIHVNSLAVITVCGCIEDEDWLYSEAFRGEVCILPLSGSVEKKAYDRNGADVANIKW